MMILKRKFFPLFGESSAQFGGGSTALYGGVCFDLVPLEPSYQS
ncbi:hypothetical protein SAMN05443636_0009 [Halobaculum gomorrense]|uniref:Uncharacterized protein n=1 Tax=Halobaculum gomorrense TaxID=43928 RepID=A0A1M5J9J2_9EURY|nr:hypothetical protein SAMN05443636_0009 [Halobaculum gomorrense]